MSDNQEPLAPFQQCEPYELAALAVLLSKGKDPAKHLPAAASLWAQAYQYREHLRLLFGGEEYVKLARHSLPVWSLGAGDSITVKEACAKYSWGGETLARPTQRQCASAHFEVDVEASN